MVTKKLMVLASLLMLNMWSAISAQTFPTPHNDVYSVSVEKHVDEDTIIAYFRNATIHSVVTDDKSGVSHTYLLTVLKEKDFNLKKVQVAQGGLHALDTHFHLANVISILNRKTGLTLIRFSTRRGKSPPREPVLARFPPSTGSTLEICWHQIMSLTADEGLNRTYGTVASVDISSGRLIVATDSLGKWGYHGCAVYKEGRLLGVVLGANPKGAGYEVQVITRNLEGVR